MSDPIDDLLAQIQSSDTPAKPQQHSPMPSQPPARSPKTPSSSIDDLLADMDGRPAPLRPVPPPMPKAVPVQPAAVQPPIPPRRDAAIDNLLTDIKSTYQEQDRAEMLQQQQQRQEEQQRQETLKRQKQAALAKQAEVWLKTLDIRSGEGAWFEEFAAKYPSRVEAAIEYLGLEG